MLQALAEFFGAAKTRSRFDRRPRIQTPPPGAVMMPIRAKPGAPVQAKLAETDGVVRSEHGDLEYSAGQHYIVRYEDGDSAPVARRIFESTYQRLPDGRYKKRQDILFHYFTLPYEAAVETLEGVRDAQPGDWIVQGAQGELYPMKAEIGRSKYDVVS